MGFLRPPMTVQLEGEVVHLHRPAAEHLVEQRRKVRAGLAPNLQGRPAERLGMLLAENRDESVVVEPGLARAPGHEHRLARTQHQIDQGRQGWRPVLSRPERGLGPIETGHALAHLADMASPQAVAPRRPHRTRIGQWSPFVPVVGARTCGGRSK